ncbi:MAG: hypothetical protein ACXV3B_11250, partial [Ilumatobacteraceae bacterium]
MMSWLSRLWKRFRAWLRALLAALRTSDRKDGDSSSGVGVIHQGLTADQTEVPAAGLDLRNDRSVISPPIVDPVYACSSVVVLRGFVAHADLEVFVDGASIARVPGGFPDPDGQLVELGFQLARNQQVQAVQHVGPVASGLSQPPVVARDYTEDYPHGPPRPEVNPAPVLVCGARTGVGNLLVGSSVWITADGAERGRVALAKEQTGVNVDPEYALGEEVRAWSQFCGDASPPSARQDPQPGPTPLPTPGFEDYVVGAEQIVITNLANGAHFTLMRNGVPIGDSPAWGGRCLVGVPPVAATDSFSAVQRLCLGDAPSAEGKGSPKPCSTLPAPIVAPVQHGDTRIRLVQHAAGSIIRVFAGVTKIGEGGGDEIALTRPIQHGEVLYVQQVVGSCVGSTVRRVEPGCVDPPITIDPADLDLFPVGSSIYQGPSFTSAGLALSIKGTIFYPANDDGPDQPFRASIGPVPLVLMVHGNHPKYRDPNDHTSESCQTQSGWEEVPNHRGYEYLQRLLARQGIASLGVYSNETNCVGLSETNIRQRAAIVEQTIQHFKAQQDAGTPISGVSVSFDRVGLLGHSRGGDAVVLTANEISISGVTVAGVITIGPTDAVFASPGRAVNTAYLSILGARDGDVRANFGAKFYDFSTPTPLKCQLYIDRANHNFFNTEWGPDDESYEGPVGGPATLPRYAQETILRSYGCGFFRAALLGHPTLGYLDGSLWPPNVPKEDIHISYDEAPRDLVDDHQQANGIGHNSRGEATQQLLGLHADEYSFRQTQATSYHTFYGNTDGMV